MSPACCGLSTTFVGSRDCTCSDSHLLCLLNRTRFLEAGALLDSSVLWGQPRNLTHLCLQAHNTQASPSPRPPLCFHTRPCFPASRITGFTHVLLSRCHQGHGCHSQIVFPNSGLRRYPGSHHACGPVNTLQCAPSLIQRDAPIPSMSKRGEGSSGSYRLENYGFGTDVWRRTSLDCGSLIGVSSRAGP